jgi:hypothetical protein
MVDHNRTSWNRMAGWLDQIQHLQEAAWAGTLAR